MIPFWYVYDSLSLGLCIDMLLSSELLCWWHDTLVKDEGILMSLLRSTTALIWTVASNIDGTISLYDHAAWLLDPWLTPRWCITLHIAQTTSSLHGQQFSRPSKSNVLISISFRLLMCTPSMPLVSVKESHYVILWLIYWPCDHPCSDSLLLWSILVFLIIGSTPVWFLCGMCDYPVVISSSFVY